MGSGNQYLIGIVASSAFPTLKLPESTQIPRVGIGGLDERRFLPMLLFRR